MIQRFSKEKQMLDDSIAEHSKALIEIQSLLDFKQKIGIINEINNSNKNSEK